MSRVKDIMSKTVTTADAKSTAYDLVREMMNRDIGCVVIVEKKRGEKGDDCVVGIVTKGDILREVIMKKTDPQIMTAQEIMSHPVVKIGPEASIEEATSAMTKNNVSKLPVVKDERLIGIVTSTDLIRGKRGKKLASAKDLI